MQACSGTEVATKGGACQQQVVVGNPCSKVHCGLSLDEACHPLQLEQLWYSSLLCVEFKADTSL